MKQRIAFTREFILGLIVLAFMIFLGLTTQFATRNGLFSMMLDVTPTILGAIALSLVIFTGNIDISGGTILGFVSYTAGQLAVLGAPFYLFAPAALVVGVLLSGLNGYITVRFKVPSMVVTLAMNMVHLGFYATFLPNSGWIENLGDNFTWFGRIQFFGVVPLIFIVSVVVAALFLFIMKFSKFGKSVYAVGGNRQAAIYAGINPDRTVIKVFLLEGLLLGAAGVLKAVTRSDVLPSSFQGREFTFIAAAVVGGVNIIGGSGKLLGAVFGALLVYLLSTAMIYMGFQDYYQYVLQGIIILIAVLITVTDFSAFRKKWLKAVATPRGGN
jgi:ribose/xylose/arabinose/galactoside ABC-type transport system permease subunit